MKKLTPKRERFVQGLFAGLSQRQAYKEAYNCDHWKDGSIDGKAWELSKNVHIMSRLQELQDTFTERNMVTKERILEELAKIGFADITDFIAFRTEKTIADEITENENGEKSLYQYKMIVEAKDSKDIDGTLISEVSIAKDGTFKFKLHDKLTALDKMGRTLGMFKDKIEHSGKLEMPDIIIGK